MTACSSRPPHTRPASRLHAAIFAGALAACASPALAEVREQLATREYAVTADPAVPLLRLLDGATPIRENGKVFHGYTRWYVKWNYRWNEAPDGSCRITRVDTSVEGTITLPKLVGGTGAQRTRFDAYLAALRTHEEGHYAFARQAGREIDGKIAALPSMRSCRALEAEANGLGYRILDIHTAREKQYDRDTDHGRTQGAWLER
ncbi:MAG: DUF922 domain-containing protein [Rhodocyclaceae bacterium]|jgi:predicted secreted Zn-dependent protease|nr:MAG: DUF922 domain-containing protein [Rhodocyclaceae bacterium]